MLSLIIVRILNDLISAMSDKNVGIYIVYGIYIHISIIKIIIIQFIYFVKYLRLCYTLNNVYVIGRYRLKYNIIRYLVRYVMR